MRWAWKRSWVGCSAISASRLRALRRGAQRRARRRSTSTARRWSSSAVRSPPREGLLGDVGEWGATPELERAPDRAVDDPLLRLCPGSIDQALEARRVHRIRRQLELVAAAAGDDPAQSRRRPSPFAAARRSAGPSWRRWPAGALPRPSISSSGLTVRLARSASIARTARCLRPQWHGATRRSADRRGRGLLSRRPLLAAHSPVSPPRGDSRPNRVRACKRGRRRTTWRPGPRSPERARPGSGSRSGRSPPGRQGAGVVELAGELGHLVAGDRVHSCESSSSVSSRACRRGPPCRSWPSARRSTPRRGPSGP